MARRFLGVVAALTYAPGAAAGKVLTSDASGNATWQAVPAASAGVFDGGSASTTYTGVAKIDCGGAT